MEPSNLSRIIEEVTKWIDEYILNGHMYEDVDLDHVNDVLTETSETPSDLTLVLRRYQKEFLAWALKQEQSVVKGGILADERGMGKTVQAISLVLAKRAIDRGQSDDETMGHTLVICRTLRGIQHWLDEIAQSTAKGTKVLTYSLVNYDYYSTEVLANYDFVLTTYYSVTRECFYVGPFDDEVDKELSLLHSVQWNRIILDEVDTITDRFSRTAKAVFALEATYRWALTSTLQTSLENLGSLVRFLRIHPYGSYFCSLCGCTPVDHIAHTIQCRICSHTGADHIHFWSKFVTQNIEGIQETEKKRRTKILLKHKVLKDILIRRTTRSRRADFHPLP